MEAGIHRTARLASHPMYPALALMLAGGWLAWPWFAVNAFALRSPRRWGDLGLSALALGLGGLLAAAIPALAPGRPAGYLQLGLSALGLAVAYVLHQRQKPVFVLWMYRTRQVVTPAPLVVLGGLVIRLLLVGPSFTRPIWG